jgi:MoxR-like ATPase
VVLTSNNFREFGDALKRRCIHLYLDYPDFEQELKIVRLKVPGIQEELAEKIVAFVQEVRRIKLKKAPSIAETLNWAEALLELKVTELDSEVFQSHRGRSPQVQERHRAGRRPGAAPPAVLRGSR